MAGLLSSLLSKVQTAEAIAYGRKVDSVTVSKPGYWLSSGAASGGPSKPINKLTAQPGWSSTTRDGSANPGNVYVGICSHEGMERHFDRHGRVVFKRKGNRDNLKLYALKHPAPMKVSDRSFERVNGVIELTRVNGRPASENEKAKWRRERDGKASWGESVTTAADQLRLLRSVIPYAGKDCVTVSASSPVVATPTFISVPVGKSAERVMAEYQANAPVVAPAVPTKRMKDVDYIRALQNKARAKWAAERKEREGTPA